MFGTKEEKAQEAKSNAWNYEIIVDAVRATKNDKIMMLDLTVNGVIACLVGKLFLDIRGQGHCSDFG